MRNKTIYSMLLILILSNCAVLPHYEETSHDQKNVIYKNYSSEQIWNAVVETIMHMNYTVTKIDKQSGFLYGEGVEWGFAPVQGTSDIPKISVFINKENESISVTCQVYTIRTKKPEKEILEFFDLLSENLKKSEAKGRPSVVTPHHIGG